jgi:hypothetical protein
MNEVFTMCRTFAVLSLAAALACATLSLTILPTAVTRAATSGADATFLIPASDGYGVADCLMGASECGKVVANAWCEAHGFSGAESFGPAAAQETSAVDTVSTAKRSQPPISITCAN